MLIAKLSIKYDRGLAHNDATDLTVDGVKRDVRHPGDVTPDGKTIRGLGTHWRSPEDKARVEVLDKESRAIYLKFRSRFLSTPLDGVYVVPKSGSAKAFVQSLTIPADMTVRVTEFELAAPSGLDGAELGEWAERIKRQLGSIQLGRSREADEDGLNALELLASCPVLKRSTEDRIKELVSQVRDQKITRVELKRHIETLNVEIEQAPLPPRRAPKIEAEVA